MGCVSFLFILREKGFATEEVKEQLWGVLRELTRRSHQVIKPQDLPALKRIMDETKSGHLDIIYAAAYDTKGNCISHSELDLNKTNLAKPLNEEEIGLLKPYIAKSTFGDEPIYMAVAPIMSEANRIGFLSVGYSTRGIKMRLRRIYQDMAAFAPILIFMSLLLSVLLAGGISRSIRLLTDQARKISKGDISGEV